MKKYRYSQKEWMHDRLSEMSDNEIIKGMIAAYNSEACDAPHWTVPRFKAEGYLETDECRMFTYSNGGRDHYNVKYFKEWCEAHRPNVLKRLYSLKVFW